MCSLLRRLQDRLWCPHTLARLSYYSRWCHNSCMSSISIAFHHCIDHMQCMHDSWPHHSPNHGRQCNFTNKDQNKWKTALLHSFFQWSTGHGKQQHHHPHVRFEEDCGFPHSRSVPFCETKKNARNFEGVFGGAWCIYGAMVDLDTMQDGKGGNPWRSQAEADMGVGTVLVSQACWPAMWLDPWHVGKWNHYIHHTNGGRMRNTYSIWFLLVVWRTNFQHCFQDNKW